MLREGLVLRRDADGLCVDTPYPLQNGALLRVRIWSVAAGESASIMVSDNGYALEQLAIFLPGPALADRYLDVRRIAQELDLEWEDGEFRFVESDLDDLAHRLSAIADAVNRALSLTLPRRRPTAGQLGVTLSAELRGRGLAVSPGARIEITPELTVTVDYRVEGKGAEAAVEILNGHTTDDIALAVDRAVTTFHLLDHGGYPGLLFAVYDPSSLAGRSFYQERFRSAAPPAAMLLGGPDAASVIARKIGADGA